MATYKGTKGFTVQILASDPTSTDTPGLLFFNSTDNKFKYVRPGGASAGTWASGGDLGTARAAMGFSSNGTQAAALAFGGNELPGISKKNESYNGTTWSEIADKMSISTQTAINLHSRGRNMLAKKLRSRKSYDLI